MSELLIKSKCGRKPGGITRFPGLCSDARQLGITPGHLWCVLANLRTSPKLLARYKALKASQQPNPTHLNLHLGANPAETPAVAAAPATMPPNIP